MARPSNADYLNRLSHLFLDEYKKPIILTKGQNDIFQSIITRSNKRVHIIAPTRYGKSLVISLGLILRAVIFPEKWSIVAPSEKKARIIMTYVINHIFDNPLFYNELNVDTPLERLKRERSKRRLTFKRGGEIFILSADTKNRKNVGEGALGFGSPNIILDESSLIPDNIYAMIKRMLGDSKNNFLLEIGNPFKRNHFYKSSQSKLYHKIFIDVEQGLSEGRFSQEYIDEMRNEDFFDILYGCKFPDEDNIDLEGWSQLILSDFVERAMKSEVKPVGKKRLGVDVSRGGSNYNVIVMRQDNYIKLISKNQINNLIDLADMVIKIAQEENVRAEDIFIDDTGLCGVVDSLRRRGWNVIAVKNQAVAYDPRFINVRAEDYWRLKTWIEGNVGVSLCEDNDELTEIKYKINNQGKIQIMSKLMMRKEGIESPDYADACAMTFHRKDLPVNQSIQYAPQYTYNSTTGYPDGNMAEPMHEIFNTPVWPHLVKNGNVNRS